MLEVEELRREAAVLTREVFAARYPRLYLVMLPARDEAPPIGFRTLVERREKIEALDALPLDDEATIVGDGGPAPSAVLVLEKAAGNPYPNQLSVGRAPNCDLVLRHASVSKLHAHFLLPEGRSPRIEGYDGRGLQLVDRGSENGTAVNGTKLTVDVPHSVAPGDVIRFGGVRCSLLPGDRLYDLLMFD
jgi:hypothetical protein